MLSDINIQELSWSKKKEWLQSKISQDLAISPSLLAADFLNLSHDISRIYDQSRSANERADFLHMDVMDGAFVPNLSFGPAIIKSVFRKFNIPLDVHLMIESPERSLDSYLLAGATSLCFHIEAAEINAAQLLAKIRENNCLAGISFKPNTNLSILDSLWQDLDYILVMSVEPGFGGQKFMQQTLPRIEELHKNAKKHGVVISVDGGVGRDQIKPLIQAGADMVVAGTSIFKSQDPGQEIAHLRQIAHQD